MSYFFRTVDSCAPHIRGNLNKVNNNNNKSFCAIYESRFKLIIRLRFTFGGVELASPGPFFYYLFFILLFDAYYRMATHGREVTSHVKDKILTGQDASGIVGHFASILWRRDEQYFIYAYLFDLFLSSMSPWRASLTGPLPIASLRLSSHHMAVPPAVIAER